MGAARQGTTATPLNATVPPYDVLMMRLTKMVIPHPEQE
jgi:hypothetical protein